MLIKFPLFWWLPWCSVTHQAPNLAAETGVKMLMICLHSWGNCNVGILSFYCKFVFWKWRERWFFKKVTEGKGCKNSIRFRWILPCLMKTTILLYPTKEWSLSFQVKVEKLHCCSSSHLRRRSHHKGRREHSWWNCFSFPVWVGVFVTNP